MQGARGQLPNLKVVYNFFLFDLVGVDVILGYYEGVKNTRKGGFELGF